MARFVLHDFKQQASFFLREKLNDARLVLTDVSRMQLLTEEATNEDPWGPETRTMAMLADAAFELEEYERIVLVIRERLDSGRKRPWRQLYKTLVLLEYLLIHGPKSMGREFRTDVCWIEELCQCNLTDQQGIDRGPMVRKKANRVLELINSPDFRNEERCRARKILVGIQGFGSNPRVYPQDGVHNTEVQFNSEDHECVCPSSHELSEQSRNAGAQSPQFESTGSQYESCFTMLLGREQGGSSEKNLSALCAVKSSSKSYRRTFSSPGYFRERRLRWQPAQDGVNESGEANIGLLNAVKENDCLTCEDMQGGLIGEAYPEGCESLSTGPSEDSHSLFKGIETSSLIYNCKLASSFHELPQSAIPKLRMKFQHQCQPSRLTDCNVKFGKAA